MRSSITIPQMSLHWPLKLMHPSHGPKVWPWWKLIVFHKVRAGCSKDFIGWNLWFYTRWGSEMFGFYIRAVR